jgi:hypothetical protein
MKADIGWLQRFIERAVEEKMCVQNHCTTCGAREFRQGLWAAIGGESKGDLGPMFGNATALAELMLGLKKKEGYTYEYERAVRLMLFEIWPFLGRDEGESKLESMLRGSWAGEVLARMTTHWASRRESQRAHVEREANAPQRCDEKKRKKAEQHAARLAAKAERDRRWREKQKGGKG